MLGLCLGACDEEALPSFEPVAEPADPLRPVDARGEVPESARITDYQLQAKLDAEAHRVEGRARVTWRNRTQRSVDTLPFHLYMNGFRADDTAWMSEARGKHRGQKRKKGSWGYIDIKRVAKLGQGSTSELEALGSDARGSELAWKEDAEPSTMTVSLPGPVQPGEAITVEIDFVTQLPHVFARTGYHEDFHMVAQWFPKLGVLEEDAGWQAHTFSLNGEFYADFGNYEVQLDVPEEMVVGATGIQVGEAEAHEAGRKTVNYLAHMVHDFAWTADPDFVEHWGEHEGIRIRQLIQKEYVGDVDAHLEAQKETLDSMQARFGPYPWSTITIVHAPEGGGGAGGMEYPTLYTTSDIYHSPVRGVIFDERMSGIFTTVHEFGHQYFQGLLASNEEAQPWLDEGMNTLSNYLTMIDWRETPDPWVVQLFGHPLHLSDMSRLAVSESLYDPVDQDAAAFRALIPSYGAMVYQKTAAIMMTLRNIVGHEAFDAALKAYALEHRFGHPKGSDLESVLVRELGAQLQLVPESEGQPEVIFDVQDYLDQALREVSEIDFEVITVTNRNQLESAGYHRDEGAELVLTPSKWDEGKDEDASGEDESGEGGKRASEQEGRAPARWHGRRTPPGRLSRPRRDPRRLPRRQPATGRLGRTRAAPHLRVPRQEGALRARRPRQQALARGRTPGQLGRRPEPEWRRRRRDRRPGLLLGRPGRGLDPELDGGAGPMKSLQRTLLSLPVLLGMWVLLLAFAAIAGAPVRSAASAALSQGGWLDDGHLLGATLELAEGNPAVIGTLLASVAAATILGFLFWIPMAGGLIESLAGHGFTPGSVLSGARWSFAMAVQTLYSWLARGIVLGLLITVTNKVAWVGVLIPIAYVSLIIAFDLARVRIVLEDAAPFHPMTMLRAWLEAFKAPILLVGGALLIAAQLASAQLPAWIAGHAEHGNSTLVMLRLAAFLPLFFSAWRISAAISRVEER